MSPTEISGLLLLAPGHHQLEDYSSPINTGRADVSMVLMTCHDIISLSGPRTYIFKKNNFRREVGVSTFNEDDNGPSQGRPHDIMISQNEMNLQNSIFF